MEIFYQDKDIIVCHKPYGVSSQESNGENMLSLISEITHTQVFPVHRLDVTTDGLMVFALKRDAAAALCAQFSERKAEKAYIALTHGKPTEPSGEMRDLIYHDKRVNKSFVVSRRRQGVKEARLEYSLIGYGVSRSLEEISALKIRLHTGRTHQIRVQLAARGMPLYGDKKYGAKSSDRIFLFSTELAFSHPKTGKQLYFELPAASLSALYEKFDVFSSAE